jgi:hypothetical protein
MRADLGCVDTRRESERRVAAQARQAEGRTKGRKRSEDVPWKGEASDAKEVKYETGTEHDRREEEWRCRGEEVIGGGGGRGLGGERRRDGNGQAVCYILPNLEWGLVRQASLVVGNEGTGTREAGCTLPG